MKKDAEVIKILTQLGLRSEPALSPEQELQLQKALDPEQQFLDDVEKLFSPKSENT